MEINSILNTHQTSRELGDRLTDKQIMLNKGRLIATKLIFTCDALLGHFCHSTMRETHVESPLKTEFLP